MANVLAEAHEHPILLYNMSECYVCVRIIAINADVM